MDMLTATTLMMVDALTVDLPELVSRVAEELLIPGNQELADVLIDILDRLVKAGLIEADAR